MHYGLITSSVRLSVSLSACVFSTTIERIWSTSRAEVLSDPGFLNCCPEMRLLHLAASTKPHCFAQQLFLNPWLRHIFLLELMVESVSYSWTVRFIFKALCELGDSKSSVLSRPLYHMLSPTRPAHRVWTMCTKDPERLVSFSGVLFGSSDWCLLVAIILTLEKAARAQSF